MYDWKFVGLSHNTVRGAAGGGDSLCRAVEGAGIYREEIEGPAKGGVIGLSGCTLCMLTEKRRKCREGERISKLILYGIFYVTIMGAAK